MVLAEKAITGRDILQFGLAGLIVASGVAVIFIGVPSGEINPQNAPLLFDKPPAARIIKDEPRILQILPTATPEGSSPSFNGKER